MAHAHSGNWRVSLTEMEMVPSTSYLDVRITGNGSDLRDIIHATPKGFSPLDPLDAAALQRANAYLKKHLILSQKGEVLSALVKSIEFLPGSQKGQARFEIKARYNRAPSLSSAPLKIKTTLFEYLSYPILMVYLGGQQLTMVSRNSESSFPAEVTVITPLQHGLLSLFSSFDGLLRSLGPMAFLLALLLACTPMRWKSRVTILAGFLLAHTLAFGLAVFQILSVPPVWWAVGVALSLLYIGFENWPSRQKSATRLLFAAIVGGFVCGGFAAGASSLLPDDAVVICLLGSALGTSTLVALVGAVVLPFSDFWRHKASQGARLSHAQSSNRLLPAQRIAAPLVYIALILVAGLNLASAVQPRKAQNAASSASTALVPGTPKVIGGYQMVKDRTQVHAVFTQVAFESSPRLPVAGVPTKWTIKVRYKEDGEPVKDFALLHAKLLHLIIVSRDMTWYTHVHPVFQGNGTFIINTVLPHAGYYRFYADYMPQGESEHEVVLHEFKVGGGNALAAKPHLAPDSLKGMWITQKVKAAPEGLPDAGNGPMYEVALMPMPSVIKANEPLMLHYQVRDAQGKPLTDLRPYMGAMGHCVVLNTDPNSYLHVHPMAEGMKHTSMTLSQMLTMKMDDTLLPTSYRGGPNIMFHTFFPKAGLYKVWAQFQHREKIITSAFVLKVE